MSSKISFRFGRIINIPILGYVIDFFVAVFRLPRLDFRVKQLWREIRVAKNPTHSDTLSLTIAALDGLREDYSALRFEHEQNLGTINVEIAGLESRVFERIAAEASATEIRLKEQIEFARAEIMFELREKLTTRKGPNLPTAADTAPTIARILEAEKLEKMRETGALRLNLGCGHVPLQDYINVDIRDLPSVDVVAPVENLPFDAGTVQEILSMHLLEHFPIEQLRRTIMPHWCMLLCHGGEFRAIVPDAEAMLADFACGEMSFDDLREVTFGLQEYDGDFHFNMFSRAQLVDLLSECGLRDIVFSFQGRQNGKCKDMEVKAIWP